MNKLRKSVAAAVLCAVQLVTAVSFSLTASAAVTDARIDTVAVGTNHTLVIKSDNTLWGSGRNDYKQLSSACDAEFTTTPVKIMSNVVSAAAGGSTSFAVDTQKNLYVWGSNANGQVNTQPSDIVATPTKILSDVVSVSASETHVLAVTADGSLYAWGSNLDGELGYNTTGDKNAPKEIMDNVVSAAAGEAFSLVVTKSGELYSFGLNDYGQLGIGSYSNITVPALAVKSGVAMAAAGAKHSVILMKDGTVYCAGLNDDGQLGTGSYSMKSSFTQTNLTGIKYVFAGGYASAAINTKNNLYTWGSNDYGQLHNGKTDDEAKPVSITMGVVSFALSNTYSIMLKDSGVLSSAGMGVYGELLEATNSNVLKPVIVGRDFDSIDAGSDYMGAIRNGDLYMWGANDCGQLGTGDYDLRTEPTKISLPNNEKAHELWCGDGYTFVRTQSGAFYCFGDNSSYQLGMSTKTDHVNRPTENEELSGKGAELSLASDHVIALYGGTVYGWGKNTSGTLGMLPDLVKAPTVIDETLISIKAISTGDYHSLAIDLDGRLWAWGSNSAGQLAVVAAKSVRIPEQVIVEAVRYVKNDGVKEKEEYEVLFDAVCAAGTHTMALSADGMIWGWGTNAYGQLGTTTSKVPDPMQINSSAYKIISTETASASITANDKLYFTGENTCGRFGIDSEKDLNSFSTLTATGVADVAMGDDFSAYILGDGAVYTCGSNIKGQLGNGSGGMKLNPTVVLNGCLVASAVKAQSISLDKSELTLKPAETALLTATVLPAEAADKAVTWSSSDTKVASVTNGTVKGIGNGTAVITASAANGSISATCKVTVKVPVTKITLGIKTKALVQGKTYQLNTKVFPTNAVDKAVKYSTSNANAVTVSETGLATAVGAGSATITVTSVSNPAVTKTIVISVTPAKTKITSKTRSADGITIKWRDMGNVTGYEIYRKVTKNGTYKLIDDIEDATSYLDKNVTKGKYYYYKIKVYTIVDGKKIYSKFSLSSNIKFK